MSEENKTASREGLVMRLSFAPSYADYLADLRIRAGEKSREELLCAIIRDFAHENGFNVPEEVVAECDLEEVAKQGLIDHKNVRSMLSKRNEAEREGRFYIEIVLLYGEDYRWPQRLMEKLDCGQDEAIDRAVKAFDQKLTQKTIS